MKIIFLDIDGPMIPSTMFLVNRMASYERQFPATTVAVLNEICYRSGAKIVFNTTHNRPFDGVPNIDVALVTGGLNAAHIHPDDRHTSYPDIPRDLAVTEWLHRHPEVTGWVALDDVRFTRKPNLIWIDPDAGLTVKHLNKAVKRLGGKPCLILM